MKKKILAVIVICLVIIGCTGCRQSEKVNYNMSKEADNFNVIRRVVAINTVTDKPLIEVIGRISINADAEDNQLEILIQTGKDEYKKHIVGLNNATTTYVIEDLYGAKVNSYKYTINYQPESIVPINFKQMNKGE